MASLLSPPETSAAKRPSALGRIVDGLQAVEKAVAVLAILGAALALTLDLLGREAVGQGLFGAQRAAVHLTFIAGLLGFALATGQGAHLRIKATDALLPASWTPAIERAGNLVSAGVLGVLAWYAAVFTLQTAGVGERSPTLGLPIWPFQAVMVWAFVSSALRHLAYASDSRLIPREPSPS